MKKIVIYLICLYQKRPFQTGFGCLFYPSCSEYTKIAIDRFGVLKGSYMGFKRILKCHPWNTPKVDEVPIKNHGSCCKIKI